jgi:DNA polymerase-3 subunit delta
MKIVPKQARDFLRQPDRPYAGVLIYGPDAGQVRERANAIAAFILSGENDPFARVELTDDQLKKDPALLADEVSAMSLMGGRRAIVVRDAGDRVVKAVESALEGPAGNNYLIVCAAELNPRSALRQLFEAHPKLAALACYKDEAMDIQAVVRQKLEGVNVSRDAMAHLTQHLGNDRAVTTSELDKILLFLGDEKTLTLEMAEALVAHNRDIALDQLCMDMAGGNAPAVASQLAQAFREGVQPIALLRASQRYFQRLYSVKEAVAAGTPLEQAVSSLRPPLFFRAVQPFTRHAQGWSLERVVRALEVLRKAEASVKQTGAAPALLVDRAFMEIATLGRLHAAA